MKRVISKMDFLPKDPAILVSSVNMLLRDEEFDTLESLCYAFMFIQVLSEERRLHQDFGKEYDAYCRHTRRF